MGLVYLRPFLILYLLLSSKPSMELSSKSPIAQGKGR